MLVSELVAGMVLAKETPPDVNFNIRKDSQCFSILNIPCHNRIEWLQQWMKSAQFVYTNSNGLNWWIGYCSSRTIWKKGNEHGDGIEGAHYGSRRPSQSRRELYSHVATYINPKNNRRLYEEGNVNVKKRGNNGTIGREQRNMSLDDARIQQNARTGNWARFHS
ncbi:hypothetical protein BU17DRAFT_65908 [Hysterangium stoloniferum]|nr:hypothetical protein BU17DRAFT_65908 [Hysterangium stoloniferum]